MQSLEIEGLERSYEQFNTTVGRIKYNIVQIKSKRKKINYRHEL